ncbi:hypothetical protein JMA_01880 [Jeotgalibacillus malaysiensis]|uniref:Uncharacterized protein n=1 Tax=Jeotgalibacillus malaysiensis TaxID=1508404 RepID=A0A0B5AGN0_9BACL|nr:hypothetical protein [Jeotgalibacillus malaysiensis]AJD89505.1 hypothetical protein JMA_01880 [Jeotgalibacillus malaysiensis]
MEIVAGKAKTPKKFLKEIEVNRNPVNINGKHYYQVIYTNRRGQLKGSVILSPQEEIVSEAREGHSLLVMYSGLIAFIYEGGIGRSQASDEFYKEPLKLMEQLELPQLEAGKEKIESLDTLLAQHKRIFDETIKTFRAADVISQQDIDHAIRTSVAMDLIHVKILEIMTDDVSVIDQWVKEMKAAGLWTGLGRNVRTFYEEMLKGEKSNLTLLATKDVPRAQHREDQIDEIYPTGAERIEREVTGYRKGLRFPEPW